MHSLRRLLLIAALLGSLVGGYVFSVGSAGSGAAHVTLAGGPSVPCTSGPTHC
jgi:hypothetical protein